MYTGRSLLEGHTSNWSLWLPLERGAIKVGAGVKGRQENYFFAKYSFLLLNFFCHMHILLHILLQRHESKKKKAKLIAEFFINRVLVK